MPAANPSDLTDIDAWTRSFAEENARRAGIPVREWLAQFVAQESPRDEALSPDTAELAPAEATETPVEDSPLLADAAEPQIASAAGFGGKGASAEAEFSNAPVDFSTFSGTFDDLPEPGAADSAGSEASLAQPAADDVWANEAVAEEPEPVAASADDSWADEPEPDAEPELHIDGPEPVEQSADDEWMDEPAEISSFEAAEPVDAIAGAAWSEEAEGEPATGEAEAHAVEAVDARWEQFAEHDEQALTLATAGQALDAWKARTETVEASEPAEIWEDFTQAEAPEPAPLVATSAVTDETAPFGQPDVDQAVAASQAAPLVSSALDDLQAQIDALRGHVSGHLRDDTDRRLDGIESTLTGEAATDDAEARAEAFLDGGSPAAIEQLSLDVVRLVDIVEAGLDRIEAATTAHMAELRSDIGLMFEGLSSRIDDLERRTSQSATDHDAAALPSVTKALAELYAPGEPEASDAAESPLFQFSSPTTQPLPAPPGLLFAAEPTHEDVGDFGRLVVEEPEPEPEADTYEPSSRWAPASHFEPDLTHPDADEEPARIEETSELMQPDAESTSGPAAPKSFFPWLRQRSTSRKVA